MPIWGHFLFYREVVALAYPVFVSKFLEISRIWADKNASSVLSPQYSET
jgi:hypothetical protein